MLTFFGCLQNCYAQRKTSRVPKGAVYVASSPGNSISKSLGGAQAVYVAGPPEKITVDIDHLQLTGDLDNGIIVLTGFNVSGKKVTAPQFVIFEFVSYFSRARYNSIRHLTILVDGESKLSKVLPLTVSSKQGEKIGPFTEVMNTSIPYSTFLAIAKGRTVTFRLGTLDLPLTDTQLHLIRDMQSLIDAGMTFP